MWTVNNQILRYSGLQKMLKKLFEKGSVDPNIKNSCMFYKVTTIYRPYYMRNVRY